MSQERLVTRIEPFGALIYDRLTTALLELDRDETRRFLKYTAQFPSEVSAPRFVHIEISNRCPYYRTICPYCYIPQMNGEELSFGQLCNLEHQLADMSVFHITFGGGEPFMRPDIFDLAMHANDVGLDVAVTTNGVFVKDDPRLRLFRQINVSLHGGNLSLVERAVLAAKKHTMVGVNFIMSKQNLRYLKPTAELCKRNDLELLLLAYKPLQGDTDQVVPYKEVRAFAWQLTKDGVRVAADGTSCELNVDGNWFVDVGSNGDVYQCSFHRESIGNILQQHFSEIWRDRPKHSDCPFHSTGGLGGNHLEN